jgi:hypothetical protein
VLVCSMLRSPARSPGQALRSPLPSATKGRPSTPFVTLKRPPPVKSNCNYTYVKLWDPDGEGIEQFATCAYCRKPLVEPFLLTCCSDGVNYCEDCLPHIEACPKCKKPVDPRDAYSVMRNGDRLMIKYLGSLQVYCIYKDDGCAHTGPRSELEQHIGSGCTRTPCLHKNEGCDWRGLSTDQPRHLADECGFTRIACPNGCEFHTSRFKMNEHAVDIQECANYQQKEQEKEDRRVQALTERLVIEPLGMVTLLVDGFAFVESTEVLAQAGGVLARIAMKCETENVKQVQLHRLDPEAFAQVFAFLRFGELPKTPTMKLRRCAEHLSVRSLVDALDEQVGKALLETGEELATQAPCPEPAAAPLIAVKATFGGRKERLQLPPGSSFAFLRAAIEHRFSLDDKMGDLRLRFLDNEDDWCSLSSESYLVALNIAVGLSPPILHVQVEQALHTAPERCVHCRAPIAALGLMCASPLASVMGFQCSLVPPSTPAADPRLFVNGSDSGSSSGSKSEPRHGVG